MKKRINIKRELQKLFQEGKIQEGLTVTKELKIWYFRFYSYVTVINKETNYKSQYCINSKTGQLEFKWIKKEVVKN